MRRVPNSRKSEPVSDCNRPDLGRTLAFSDRQNAASPVLGRNPELAPADRVKRTRPRWSGNVYDGETFNQGINDGTSLLNRKRRGLAVRSPVSVRHTV